MLELRFMRLVATLFTAGLVWGCASPLPPGGSSGGRCGDGQLVGTEQCDDGNTQSGDGCSSACTLEEGPICGDGTTDSGEACDDGNTQSGDGCSSTCTLEAGPSCGDGIRQTGEACDDGNSMAGDGCEPTCTYSETLCADLAPLTAGTCAVTPGDGSKLITGTVLTPTMIYRGGQLLVDDAGIIACAGCDCSAMAPAATKIHCPAGVISPGLINTHDHITYTQNSPYTDAGVRYDHRHDWRIGLNGKPKITTPGGATDDEIHWGELRFLMGGATATVGSGAVTGLLRNLDRDSALQEGLAQKAVHFETFPLGDTNGVAPPPDTCGYPSIDTQASIAADDAYLPHVSEGIDARARNEFACLSSSANGGQDLCEPQSAFIHSIGLVAPDYAAMAEAGTALIWSPRSNITLYGDTAVVTAAARLGVAIALGTDWVATGSMNLVRELRCADDFSRTYLDGFFSDRDLWRMVTDEAARVTATDDAIGVLAPSFTADISIWNGAAHPDYRAIIDADPADTVLVLRGGKVLYGDAAVVSAIPASGTCDTLDVCGASKALCVQSEIGQDFDALHASVGSIYPAFFCGVPDNEPSCVPLRAAPTNGSTIYSGAITTDDADGDGIAGASDNCPRIFNPVRPMDDGLQADSDQDGTGDACDPCPVEPNATVCSPLDTDHDGVPNDSDNCPAAPNADQADADGDKKGDACDGCPTQPNPDNFACPATIYDIKNGTIAVGSAVSVKNALVTGANTAGFFLQVTPSDTGYMGPDFSGIFVFAPATAVLPGDRITVVTATISNYFGQTQLNNATVMIDSSLGEAPPDPVAEVTANVMTGGPRAAALEGVIVQVSDVTVTDINPAVGPGDTAPTHEFVGADSSGGALRFNDFLFLIAPFPTQGQTFTSLTGILNYRNNDSKLEPRAASDITLGPPVLAGFSSSSTFAREGETGTSCPVALAVMLTGPALADTWVTIDSTDPAALSVAGGGVTIAAGQSSAPVIVTGLLPSPSVTLTASLDGLSSMADVRVLGSAEQPVLVALDPPSATVVTGGSIDFTVTLDIPAPPGGTQIDLMLTPATAGSVPVSVTVPPCAISATFTYVDAGTDPSATVTATLGPDVLSSTITVFAGGGSLVINEIDYDQIGTDSAEFVEIFNGTSSPISLANLAVVLVNGSTGLEYRRIALAPAGTLAAGAYLVLAPAAMMIPPPALKLDLPLATDNLQNGAPDAVGIVDLSTGMLVDALSYEGAVTMGVVTGIGAMSFVEGTALSAAVADSNTVPGSLIRNPNGADTNNAASDWIFATTPTPAAANIP